MNNEEYWSQTNARSMPNYRMIHAKLKEWKTSNNINERCLVHHRDDTEETRKYNEEHYERWGLNEDGSFEYGKYVIFMTCAEHNTHHKTSENLSEETRAKLSATKQGENNPMYGKQGKNNPNYGKKHSEETRAKMSTAQQGNNNPMYGKQHSEETREKMSVKASAVQCGIKVLYATYKNNGGTLKWNDFKKALSNGEITFEMQPITIYTNK